jgi:AcrR family transcriptional regulator
LDAAERVVMRDGPEASMNSIAAEAGVTKPILYRHFGDKQGLYQVLAERHIQTLLSQARTALRGPGSWRSRMETVIDAYLALIETSPQLYRFLMHRASPEAPHLISQLAPFLRRLGDEVGEGIQAELGGEGGDQRPPGQCWAIWGHGIVGMMQAAGDWWLTQRQVTRAELVRHLADLLWGAVAGAGSPTPQPAHPAARAIATHG